MTKTMQKYLSTGAPVAGNLTLDDIISRVYESFSARNRERVAYDDVARIIQDLDFSERRVTSRAPQLHIRRLRFTGEKRIGGIVSPVNYDQGFAPGVNVICIPKNNAGKSSILKTIKLALTGDDDYDVDVRTWIKNIWLIFTLDGSPYTSLISTAEDETRALLVAGEELRPLSEVAQTASYRFVDASGTEDIKAALRNFFFQCLGLKELSWTQQMPGEIVAAKRTASWETYFQGLMIPDSSDRYLICDPQHAYGAQDGLIVSTFLGLHFAEPLNRLGVEAKLAKKQHDSQIQHSEEERQRIEQIISQLETKLQENRQAIDHLIANIQARRSAVEGGEPAQRLISVQNAMMEKQLTRQKLEREREELNENIQRKRAAARRRREMAQLRLHFTGLSVKICPNCDASVDGNAIVREQQTHQCRLCGKPAHDADPDEVTALEAEASAIEAEAQYDEDGRKAINQQLATIRADLEDLERQLEPLHQATQQGLSYALATPEEEAERTRLLMEIGGLEVERNRAQRQLNTQQPDIEKLDIRQRVLEKVRELVREEADHLNASLLERLGQLTNEVAQRIGAESITHLTCSALGKVELYKHGEKVAFKNINNEGERLRVKLAFFLSLMRIARDPNAGHHPGLLLIDQPGSAEMVSEDFQALMAVFRQLDAELAADLQIICCTARSEAEQATASSKIYGPQAPPYAF